MKPDSHSSAENWMISCVSARKTARDASLNLELAGRVGKGSNFEGTSH